MTETALVTGGNKGIGREIVRRLAAEGLTVYLGARDEVRGRAAARELAAEGAAVGGNPQPQPAAGPSDADRPRASRTTVPAQQFLPVWAR